MKVGILGCGSWAMALALVIARHSGGHQVVLWGRDAAVSHSINVHGLNFKYLSRFRLPGNVTATGDLQQLLGCEGVFVVVPVSALDEVVLQLKLSQFPASVPLVVCSKGIDTNTALLPIGLVASVCENPLAFLSGPNFASEIAAGKPACASIATAQKAVFEPIMGVLSPQLRLHYTDDLVGVQVCAAIKNVIAIASGMIEGMNFGENVKAALLTVGLQLMARLSESLGGKGSTVTQPCGIGDLVLSCSSRQSRNYSFGIALASGAKRCGEGQVIEGKNTLNALRKLLVNQNIKEELLEVIYAIVYEGREPSCLLDCIFANDRERVDR